jgi:hypothetical protein
MGTSSGFASHKEPAPTHIRLKHLEDNVGGMKHDIGGMKHDMGDKTRYEGDETYGAASTGETRPCRW